MAHTERTLRSPQHFLLQACETFPSFSFPLSSLWFARSRDRDREKGVSGSGLSRLSLRSYRSPVPSVSRRTRTDWLQEADPQVSSAHRGAGRREGDQSPSVSIRNHLNSLTDNDKPPKANEFDLFGCKNTRNRTEDAVTPRVLKS